jgi:hypothetical protein
MHVEVGIRGQSDSLEEDTGGKLVYVRFEVGAFPPSPPMSLSLSVRTLEISESHLPLSPESGMNLGRGYSDRQLGIPDRREMETGYRYCRPQINTALSMHSPAIFCTDAKNPRGYRQCKGNMNVVPR